MTNQIIIKLVRKSLADKHITNLSLFQNVYWEKVKILPLYVVSLEYVLMDLINKVILQFFYCLKRRLSGLGRHPLWRPASNNTEMC